MAKITFKAKIHDAITVEGEKLYSYIQVPTLNRSHCDLPTFRSHAKFGGLANSDLFLNSLSRVKRDITNTGGWFRLDQIPANVTVDQSGFLAIVTIEV